MIHTIKLARAARATSLSAYPATWSEIIARIPPSAVARLTGAEVAEVAQAVAASYWAGERHAIREVLDEGAVWDGTKLREIV